MYRSKLFVIRMLICIINIWKFLKIIENNKKEIKSKIITAKNKIKWLSSDK